MYACMCVGVRMCVQVTTSVLNVQDADGGWIPRSEVWQRHAMRVRDAQYSRQRSGYDVEEGPFAPVRNEAQFRAHVAGRRYMARLALAMAGDPSVPHFWCAGGEHDRPCRMYSYRRR